jgi:hypothetical protein
MLGVSFVFLVMLVLMLMLVQLLVGICYHPFP